MRFPILAGALALLASTTGSPAVDLHHFWDQACSECHGHSAEFARRFLTVENGRLLGRHHRDDLLRFLGSHHLPPTLVVPVYDMLLAQASTEPRFRDRCGNCHETAAGLARTSLVVKEGVLYGRATDRPVAEFLKRHAGLQPDNVPFFVDLLTRVEREVHGTP